MKSPPTLSVAEFHQLLTQMTAQAEAELRATRARLDAYRAEHLPPG